ncbi:MAG TPA: hypothetical protein VF586_00035 [Pyrinomonadaceae bacterium]|jgi:hypothetical protein
MRALAFALALAPAARAQAAQTEPPRRPQGPAAGPVIKLPPGAGAAEERAQTPGAWEEAAPAPTLPQRGEYCFIGGFRYHQKGFSSSPRVPAAYVRYLPEGSEEIEGGTEEDALGNALVKLGEDGWELTAIQTNLHLEDGDGKATSVYFFKRPKRRE